ncbi:MAG TPA: spore gernimation protein [Desulfotomaculum sp.]|nr:spore gernimation protein [Desulfotomaculum sp.]
MNCLQKWIIPVIALLFAALSSYWLISGEAENSPANLPGALKSEPGREFMDISLYYVKFTDRDSYLVREVHHVPFTNDGPQAAVNELISGSPQTNGAAKVLPAGTKLLNISINTDGQAVVNFSEEVLSANVGASGEILGIQSIVNTLTEFPQIKSVSFQVNGQLDSRTKDWWGHMGLYDQPFKRNLEKVNEPAIWVTHPVENQTAGVPLLVKGSALTPGGSVTARLLDENGSMIAEGTVDGLQKAPDRGEFEIGLTFNPPGKGKGTLEIFPAGKGGSPQDIVKIPILWP